MSAGFDTDKVLVAWVHLPILASRDWRRQEWETFAEITRRLEGLPGVRSAGAITNLMTFDHPEEAITVEGRPFVADRTNSVLVNTEDVTPEFFRSMSVPLLSGRFFTSQEQNAQIALVNESFARRFFPGENPVGKRFKEGGPEKKDAWTHDRWRCRRHAPARARDWPHAGVLLPQHRANHGCRHQGEQDPASLGPSVREAIAASYAERDRTEDADG